MGMRDAPPMFREHGHFIAHGHFIPHGPFMLLYGLFLLVLFAFLIGLLLRRIGGRRIPPFAFRPDQPPFQPPVQPVSSHEILRQRYARGEIDAATFDQMRERLDASERPRE